MVVGLVFSVITMNGSAAEIDTPFSIIYLEAEIQALEMEANSMQLEIDEKEQQVAEIEKPRGRD